MITEDIKAPVLRHNSAEEDIKDLENWCRELARTLNVNLNNISEADTVTSEELAEAIDRSEKELRGYIVKRFKEAE